MTNSRRSKWFINCELGSESLEISVCVSELLHVGVRRACLAPLSMMFTPPLFIPARQCFVLRAVADPLCVVFTVWILCVVFTNTASVREVTDQFLELGKKFLLQRSIQFIFTSPGLRNPEIYKLNPFCLTGYTVRHDQQLTFFSFLFISQAAVPYYRPLLTRVKQGNKSVLQRRRKQAGYELYSTPAVCVCARAPEGLNECTGGQGRGRGTLSSSHIHITYESCAFSSLLRFVCVLCVFCVCLQHVMQIQPANLITQKSQLSPNKTESN